LLTSLDEIVYAHSSIDAMVNAVAKFSSDAKNKVSRQGGSLSQAFHKSDHRFVIIIIDNNSPCHLSTHRVRLIRDTGPVDISISHDVRLCVLPPLSIDGEMSRARGRFAFDRAVDRRDLWAHEQQFNPEPQV
jgi:hypothetical protein